jgi:hypothetical protein
MPRGDRTGPDGQGPMTGRGLGYCAGYSNPGFSTGFFGRGIGWRRSYGRGLGLGFRGGRGPGGYYPPYGYPSYQTLSKEEELGLLKAQSENIKNDLKEIQKRISELETKRDKT